MPDLETDSTTSITDDVDLLESEEEVKPHDESSEDKDEKVIDGKGEDEEQEEEKPEKVSESIPPHERPTISALKEKYPDIFKDFPSLKDMYFREQEFTNLFPSIDEAKTAFENSEAFETTRDDIFKGDGVKFFSAIKEVNEDSFKRFAGKILPALFKVSSDAHWEAVVPLLENVSRSLFAEGVKTKSEEMQNAAKVLSTYLFNDTEIAEGKKTTVKERPEEDKSVKAERDQFENEKLTSFTTEVTSNATSELKNIIKVKVDAEEDLSDFVKDAITNRVIKEVGNQMDADKAHLAYMDTLWAKAKKSGYTNDLKSRIISAYLARAKSLIPSVRSRLISEARGTKQRSSDKTREKVNSIENRKDQTSSGRSSNGDRTVNSKNIDWSKTSDEDILNDNITYRK